MDNYGLTKEQCEEITKSFEWFDKDKDGLIDENEICLALRVGGLNPTTKQAREMVEAVDGDGDGKINLQEFKKMMAEKALHIDKQDSLRKAFKVFDKNGDGHICAEELKRTLTSIGERLTEKEVAELLSKGDINKDGLICYEEFVILMTELHPES